MTGNQKTPGLTVTDEEVRHPRGQACWRPGPASGTDPRSLRRAAWPAASRRPAVRTPTSPSPPTSPPCRRPSRAPAAPRTGWTIQESRFFRDEGQFGDPGSRDGPGRPCRPVSSGAPAAPTARSPGALAHHPPSRAARTDCSIPGPPTSRTAALRRARGRPLRRPGELARPSARSVGTGWFRGPARWRVSKSAPRRARPSSAFAHPQHWPPDPCRSRPGPLPGGGSAGNVINLLLRRRRSPSLPRPGFARRASVRAACLFLGYSESLVVGCGARSRRIRARRHVSCTGWPSGVCRPRRPARPGPARPRPTARPPRRAARGAGSASDTGWRAVEARSPGGPTPSWPRVRRRFAAGDAARAVAAFRKGRLTSGRGDATVSLHLAFACDALGDGEAAAAVVPGSPARRSWRRTAPVRYSKDGRPRS